MPGSRPSSEPHNCESFLFLSGLDAKGTMTFPIDAGEETCPACKNDSCKFHGGVRTWLHHTQNSCGLCTVGFFPGLFCRLFASSRKLLIWYLWPYQTADSWADVGEGTCRKRYEVQPQHRVATWKVEWERVHSKNSQEHSKQHSVAAGTSLVMLSLCMCLTKAIFKGVQIICTGCIYVKKRSTNIIYVIFPPLRRRGYSF